MTSITKEQILETLRRLRWYAQHYYYGPEARDLLEAHTITHGNRRFGISVRDDGNFEVRVKDADLTVLYEARAFTVPPPSATSIVNLEYQVKVLNKGDLSPEEAAWAEEAGAFVGSCFQRTNAFTFLARSTDVTLDRIAEDLSQLKPNA